jgi:hypothetical protein
VVLSGASNATIKQLTIQMTLTLSACLLNCLVFILQPWHFVVLSGASKAAFEELTIQLCQQRLPAEKAEATVAKLRRKQAKDWPKVGRVVCGKISSSSRSSRSSGCLQNSMCSGQGLAKGEGIALAWQQQQQWAAATLCSISARVVVARR